MSNALYRLIREVTGTELQVDMAARAGVDQTAISRWKKGANFSTDNAIAVARSLGLSPVEVLTRVGLITQAEADVVVHITEPAEPSNEELVALLRERLGLTDSGGAPPGGLSDGAWADAQEHIARAAETGARRSGSAHVPDRDRRS